MSKKDLPPRLLTRHIPGLVRHYKGATKKVFGFEPYVSKKQYGKFLVMEDDLREAGVSTIDYAETVTTMLEKWVRRKGFRCVPINTFLCDWVYQKYFKVHNSKTVSILIKDNTDILLHDELKVARTYITYALGKDPMKFCDVVEELKPVLNPEWILVYYKKKGRPIKKSLEILQDEYGLTGARTYMDIIGAL